MLGVAVKRADADDEEAVARLRREAALLERLAHPGVVELVELVGDDDGGEPVELRTLAVPGPPFTSLAGAEPELVGRAVAALATTVADLHDLGIAHTRIAAEHVLLDEAGRPVLCGLADAVAATPGERPAADDVAALGRLLLQLLPPAALSSLRHSPRGLDDIARTATTDAWTARPTARALADSLWSVLEPARPPAAAPRTKRKQAAHRRWVVGGTGGAALVAAALVAAALVVALGPARHRSEARPAHERSSTPNTVEIDGRRFTIGDAGDQVVTGRFDCSHTTAAVFTSTGGLFVFDELARPDHDSTARHLRDADPAATLVATDDDGDGCDELTLQPEEGDDVTISPKDAP